MVSQHVRVVQCDDGSQLSLNLYINDKIASQEDLRQPSKGVLVIAPALGVPVSFYDDYARFMATNGFLCISFSYRGTGESVASKTDFDVTLDQWGAEDIECIIRYAESLCDELGAPNRIHFVGHSIGGQVLGMAESSERLSSIKLVASSSPHWRRWSFPKNLSILFVSHVAIPFFAIGNKQFPSHKLGLGKEQFPAKAARQWARWMRDPDYLFGSRFGFKRAGYSQIKAPILCLGFEDDELAPSQNIDRLVSHFDNAKVTRKQVHPSAYQRKTIGHSGYFRKTEGDLVWQEYLDWLDEQGLL